MDFELVPPFEGQTPDEIEDFKQRGIAGVVKSEEFGRVEVPKGQEVAAAIKAALAQKRKEKDANKQSGKEDDHEVAKG